MDSLRPGGEYRAGECYPPRGFHLQTEDTGGHSKDNSHSHSNSDSGLSSLSGRTSCMSPLSVVSTVSSASSGSSRASLRSASIVSSSTIPLEEEEEMEATPTRRTQGQAWEEEQEISRLAADLFKLMPVQANVSSLFGKSYDFTNCPSLFFLLILMLILTCHWWKTASQFLLLGFGQGWVEPQPPLTLD